MEKAILPTLQKTTSVGLPSEEPDKQQDLNGDKQRFGSFPLLPKDNESLSKDHPRLMRNVSCFNRYRSNQIESSEERMDLYRRIHEFIRQIIDNPSKIQELLSELLNMENSITSKKERGSIKSNDSGQKKDQKQKPIKSQNMNTSITLDKSVAQQNITNFKAEFQINEKLAQSIQFQYPNEDSFASYDKLQVAVSESLSNSNFGAQSIQLQMIDSLNIPKLAQVYKNISILLSQDSKSSLFSDGSEQSLSRIDFPQISFNHEFIVAVFGDASPFLINLALSLLFKFFLKSQTKLNSNNAYWILGAASIVSYKIFHDETLQGIIDYFSEALQLKREQVTYLERWFLKELNYEVLINNKHYTEIMMKLLKIQ